MAYFCNVIFPVKLEIAKIKDLVFMKVFTYSVCSDTISTSSV